MSESMDPLSILWKAGGLGGLLVAATHVLRYFRSTKKEEIDAEKQFRDTLLARCAKLELDIDHMRDHYEIQLGEVRKALEACRDECRKLAFDADNFARFKIMPRRPEAT